MPRPSWLRATPVAHRTQLGTPNRLPRCTTATVRAPGRPGLKDRTTSRQSAGPRRLTDPASEREREREGTFTRYDRVISRRCGRPSLNAGRTCDCFPPPISRPILCVVRPSCFWFVHHHARAVLAVPRVRAGPDGDDDDDGDRHGSRSTS